MALQPESHQDPNGVPLNTGGAGTWTPPRKTALAPTPGGREVTSLQAGTLRILERTTGHTGAPGCGGTPSVPAHRGAVLPCSVCCCHPPATCTASGVPHSPSRRGVPAPAQSCTPNKRAGGTQGARRAQNSGEGSAPLTLPQRRARPRPPHYSREEVSAPPRARVARTGRGLRGLGELLSQAMIRGSRGSVPAH